MAVLCRAGRSTSSVSSRLPLELLPRMAKSLAGLCRGDTLQAPGLMELERRGRRYCRTTSGEEVRFNRERCGVWSSLLSGVGEEGPVEVERLSDRSCVGW